VSIYRICGEIAVSRSIGDPAYKNFTPGEHVQTNFFWPEGHSQHFMADLVIPLPESKVMAITKKMDFLILASDGLWDVLSSQEAVDNVK
jgi:serine/threonine protein phosphatase PrpC